LQEEYCTAISSLEEALTTAQKDNKTLQRHKAELNAQVRGNAKA
jgi:hypothetical protein